MLSEVVTSLPVAVVAIATLVAFVILLVQCVCRKGQSSSLETDNGVVNTNHNSALISPGAHNKAETGEVNGIHLDIETGVTPLNVSIGSQNGNVHSRGNSVDLTKIDRHSGASSGSSPRPTTLGRELPDIPVNNRSLTLPADGRGSHSHLPDISQHARTGNPSQESHSRGVILSTHLHTQLPDIPHSASCGTKRSPDIGLRSSPRVSRQQLPPSNADVTLRSQTTKEKTSSVTDDYDHIEEAVKKKTRPRSDYDHVILEGGEKRVVLSKDKLRENDYAEVTHSSLTSSQQDVTVIPISKPIPTSQMLDKTRHKKSEPVHKVNSIDDPYNRIKGDDPPYNRIKSDDDPYNRIKSDDLKDDDPYNKVKGDDPYNKVKGDDPYNKVKGDDPYNKVKGDDPYNKVKGDDPYNKVKGDDPYNKVKGDDPYNKVKGDDPYNKVKGDDPYNKVKGDDPYNKVKGDDPYNKVKGDDPYNKVKGYLEIDDLDPYDAVIEGPNSRRSSNRAKKSESFSFKGAISDPYSFVDEERNVSNQTDPYARVVDTESEIDDPYNKVLDDGIQTENILPEYGEDDYATVNKVGEVEYAKVNKPSGQHVGNAPTVTTSAQIRMLPVSNNRAAAPSPREEIFQDEYATVVKVKKLTTCSSSVNQAPGPASSGSGGAHGHGHNQSRIGSPDTRRGTVPGHEFQRHVHGSNELINVGGASGAAARSSRDRLNIAGVPPEPPRAYAADQSGMDDVDGAAVGIEDLADTDHYNTVSLVRDGSTSSDRNAGKKEPPYNKLSVRESLASLNARAASNAYEYVSEVDNVYATVDGSSGDGVVRPKTTATAAVQPRESQTYSEIDAPAPPSLDSLHETAKQHQDEIRRKTDSKQDYYNLDKSIKGQGHQATSSDQGQGARGHTRTSSDHSQFKTPTNEMSQSFEGRVMSQSFEGRVMSSSFEGRVMSSSCEGRVPIATQENDDLDFDPSYQAVQEGKGSSDGNSEFDPNYETVDEANSKSKYEEINGARPKKIRPHIYEVPDEKRKYEVVKDGETITVDGKIRAHVYEEVTVTGEARRLRQRVLNQHTYEEVTDVKGQGDKHSNRSNKGAEGQSSNEGQKKKKEKAHSRTSSAERLLFGKKKSDDKGKEGKRKSDGKDGKK